MLIRSTWIFQPLTDAVVPRTVSLAMAHELHDKMRCPMGSEQIPSISFSGIVGCVQSKSEFLVLSAKETYTMSLCGLAPNASEAIANLQLPEEFIFLGYGLKILSLDQKCNSYEQLYKNCVAQDPVPSFQHHLQFESPTAFNQDNQILPLPLPRLMFRSWLKRWNYFSNIYLGGEELLTYLARVIAIRHLSIRTRTIKIQHGSITGFLGTLRLQINHQADPLLANIATLLLSYAEYSGTGIKTRLGMGASHLVQEDLYD